MESRPGSILLKEDSANSGPGSPAPGSSGTFFPTPIPFGLNPSLSTVPDLGTLFQFSNKLQFPHLQTRMASLPCVMLRRSDEPPDTPAQHALRRRQPLFHIVPVPFTTHSQRRANPMASSFPTESCGRQAMGWVLCVLGFSKALVFSNPLDTDSAFLYLVGL